MDSLEINIEENRQRMQRGELYYAFTPDLIAQRLRCERACQKFNVNTDISRRTRVKLWREIINDPTALPPLAGTEELDEQQFSIDPWVLAPVHIDYGTNVHVGPGVFINFNCTILDTCAVHIGARTLIGPNVSIFAASHPEDPFLRNGTNGPELGKAVTIGEDAWIAGNVTILPGVTIGRGAIIGAGSVVTRDVPEMWIAAGNPARLLREVRIASNQVPKREMGQVQETANADTGNNVNVSQTTTNDYKDEDQGW